MSHVLELSVFIELMKRAGYTVRESEGRIHVVDEAGMSIASSLKWVMDDTVYVARHPFRELLDRRVA